MNGTVSPSNVVTVARSDGIAPFGAALYGSNPLPCVGRYTYSTRVSTEQFSSRGAPRDAPDAVVKSSVRQRNGVS